MASEIADLIELLQRSTERTAEALDARMHEWRTQQASDYQRVLDSLYRLERKVDGAEKGQKDMYVAQGVYQDADSLDRHQRQAQNDRRFRRLELWLASVTLAVLIVVARVLWAWLGGV